MKDNFDKYRELYILAELTYKKKLNNLVVDVNDLFPIDWYNYEDYKIKTEILSNAIKNNVLIENTKLYKEYVEQNKCLSLKE